MLVMLSWVALAALVGWYLIKVNRETKNILTTLIVISPLLLSVYVLNGALTPSIVLTSDLSNSNKRLVALQNEVTRKANDIKKAVEKQVSTEELEKIMRYITFSEGSWFRVGFIFSNELPTLPPPPFVGNRDNVVGTLYQHRLAYAADFSSLYGGDAVNPSLMYFLNVINKYFIIDGIVLQRKELILYNCDGEWTPKMCSNPQDVSVKNIFSIKTALLQYEYGEDTDIKNVKVDVLDNNFQYIKRDISFADALRQYGPVGGVYIVKREETKGQ
jgi:hypothetical protein